jgi:hypothetical protein
MSEDPEVIRGPHGFRFTYSPTTLPASQEPEAIDPEKHPEWVTLVEDLRRESLRMEEARQADPMPDPGALTVGELIKFITFLSRTPTEWLATPIIGQQCNRREVVLLASPGWKAFLDWKDRARLHRLSRVEAAEALLNLVGERTGKLTREIESMPLLDAVRLLEQPAAPPVGPPVGPAEGALTDPRNAALHDDTVAELMRYLEELEKPPSPFVPTGCASDAYYFTRQNVEHENGKINLREYIDGIRGIDRLSLICLDRGEELNLPFVRRFVKSVVERTGLSVGEVKSLTLAEAVDYLERSEPQTVPPAGPPVGSSPPVGSDRPSDRPEAASEQPARRPVGEPAAGPAGSPREDRQAAVADASGGKTSGSRAARQARKVPRGTLDERAAIEIKKNPSLTYEQLANILECNAGTLRDAKRYPLLAAAKKMIKAERERFRRGDTWEDRLADDD